MEAFFLNKYYCGDYGKTTKNRAVKRCWQIAFQSLPNRPSHKPA